MISDEGTMSEEGCIVRQHCVPTGFRSECADCIVM
jgi:hypothetical protein